MKNVVMGRLQQAFFCLYIISTICFFSIEGYGSQFFTRYSEC